MPYSLIKPLENELTKIEPNVLLLFRPQWSYDYTCREDLFENYNELLTETYELLTDTNKKTVSEKCETENESNKKLFVIAFPSIERKNILLHCLLGHELGHVLFSTKELLNIDLFSNTAITEIRKKIPEDNLKNGEKLSKRKTKKIQKSINYMYLKLWMSGFEEIVSDLIGTLLFGPSFLFAQLESIFQNGFLLDDPPNYKNYYYPPWRTRLRYIYNLCNELKYFPIPDNIFQDNKPVREKINKRIDFIKNTINNSNDKKILFKKKKIKIAYEQIFLSIEDIKTHLIKNLKNISFKPKDFYNKIENMIDRINNDITPNEVMNIKGATKKVNLFEIIAAGWFYKIGFIDNIKNLNDVDEIYNLTEKNSRLILKAIEYSYITEKYNDFLNRRKK